MFDVNLEISPPSMPNLIDLKDGCGPIVEASQSFSNRFIGEYEAEVGGGTGYGFWGTLDGNSYSCLSIFSNVANGKDRLESTSVSTRSWEIVMLFGEDL